jgi:predicted RNA binding protein with dsRBD fold (UPF0201 family)
MTGIEVTVRTTVNPTESFEKVETAVRNVLGEINLDSSSQGDITILEGHYSGLDSLRFLRDLLRRMRIRDAAHALFTRSAQEGLLSFGLNKQAAYTGRVSFYRSREAPLGPIQIIVVGDIDSVVIYLCE